MARRCHNRGDPVEQGVRGTAEPKLPLFRGRDLIRRHVRRGMLYLMRLRVLIALMLGALVAISIGEAQGPGLAGTWLTQDGMSKIRFEPCGVVLCGHVVWVREPNHRNTDKSAVDPDRTTRARDSLGSVVLTNIRPLRSLEWSARAYNAARSRPYDVTLSLTLRQLTVQRCLFWGVFCRRERWIRVE